MRIGPVGLAVMVTATVLLAACSKEGPAAPASTPDPAGETQTAPVNPGSLGVLEPNRPKVGEVAPDFALLDVRDGSVRKLSDFRGKAVILNWYASWCDPCKDEIPDLQEASVALPDELVVLGLDYKEGKGKALEMLDDLGATYPAVLDSDGDVAAHYRATGTPTTYFLDADGVVRAIKVGPFKSKELEENLAKVNVTYAVQ